MNYWLLLAQLLYLLVLAATVVRIVYDTEIPAKTLGYLLLVILLPVVGILFYHAVGTNHRKRKLYRNKLIGDSPLRQDIVARSRVQSEEEIAKSPLLTTYASLPRLMLNENLDPLTVGNTVEILVNGEQKLPRVLEALGDARDHIHVEYYRFEDDLVGRAIEEALTERARAGVKVRLIYDDFGSRSIRGKMAERMKQAGIEVVPFYKITLSAFANRINYRNHRKIIVVDGRAGFVGGINVSEDYVNGVGDDKKAPFWRDTHLMITGPAVQQLQAVFLNDWRFCSGQEIPFDEMKARYFSVPTHSSGDKPVQITASGPDSNAPAIMYSIIEAINLAQREVLITTPYFIPGESLLNAICIAVGSGVDVRLLTPLKGDSIFVSKAAASYYERLLRAGVKIYRYKKGFVHAKTLVADRSVAIVGTANLDVRSFDLNFEINAIVYDKDTGNRIADLYAADCRDAVELTLATWNERGVAARFGEKLARLLSPVL
ncbi:cardiolipin synthase [Neolewinella antarctica]|uniref:Cardiolipin synthase n=1 Tax=Neolewinella antarctica TaxID=442734 RepID=A0ABX0XA21_9BACT|nr:cardiolipin synthase [Neolewinella antarctica]NJC25895.1 cardiolipin synthase [Neolewinella antarctica]